MLVGGVVTYFVTMVDGKSAAVWKSEYTKQRVEHDLLKQDYNELVVKAGTVAEDYLTEVADTESEDLADCTQKIFSNSSAFEGLNIEQVKEGIDIATTLCMRSRGHTNY